MKAKGEWIIILEEQEWKKLTKYFSVNIRQIDGLAHHL